jgi:hypothetical protein
LPTHWLDHEIEKAEIAKAQEEARRRQEEHETRIQVARYSAEVHALASPIYDQYLATAREFVEVTGWELRARRCGDCGRHNTRTIYGTIWVNLGDDPHPRGEDITWHSDATRVVFEIWYSLRRSLFCSESFSIVSTIKWNRKKGASGVRFSGSQLASSEVQRFLADFWASTGHRRGPGSEPTIDDDRSSV